MSIDKNERELRVVLEEEVFDKLDELRKYHGIKNMTELIRFLITKEYRLIKGDS